MTSHQTTTQVGRTKMLFVIVSSITLEIKNITTYPLLLFCRKFKERSRDHFFSSKILCWNLIHTIANKLNFFERIGDGLFWGLGRYAWNDPALTLNYFHCVSTHLFVEQKKERQNKVFKANKARCDLQFTLCGKL